MVNDFSNPAGKFRMKYFPLAKESLAELQPLWRLKPLPMDSLQLSTSAADAKHLLWRALMQLEKRLLQNFPAPAERSPLVLGKTFFAEHLAQTKKKSPRQLCQPAELKQFRPQTRD
jgi:hypothetical protein